MTEPRKKLVCCTCGGTNVQVDAYAEWDEVAQQWEVASTFDKGGYCADCDAETRSDFVAIREEVKP